MLSASAPMSACPRCVWPGILTIAGAMALDAPHAGVPYGHARNVPQRRPIEPVNRVLRGGGPFTGLALQRAR